MMAAVCWNNKTTTVERLLKKGFLTFMILLISRRNSSAMSTLVFMRILISPVEPPAVRAHGLDCRTVQLSRPCRPLQIAFMTRDPSFATMIQAQYISLLKAVMVWPTSSPSMRPISRSTFPAWVHRKLKEPDT